MFIKKEPTQRKNKQREKQMNVKNNRRSGIDRRSEIDRRSGIDRRSDKERRIKK